jgi:hypothetical protein
VDGVGAAVMPMLHGEGIPLFPPPAMQIDFAQTSHKIYDSRIVALEYDVPPVRR